MQFIIIKAIFILLINITVIICSFSVNSVEIIKVYPNKSLKTNSVQLQSFKIVNLVSDIKYDYVHNMARYAESKMASINSRTLAIVYPVGKKISDLRPYDLMVSGGTHEVVLTQSEINELLLRTSVFIEETFCDNKITLPFDRAIQKGTGNIIINNLDGTTITTIAVDSSNVTFKDNIVVIDYGNTKLIDYMEQNLSDNIDRIAKVVEGKKAAYVNGVSIFESALTVNLLIPSGVIRDENNNAFNDVMGQKTLKHYNNIRKNIVRELKLWFEAGGGGANAITYSKYCDNVNNPMVLVLVSVNIDHPVGKIDKLDLQYSFFHEAYHSFQEDNTMCEVSGENYNWLIEGAADYFAYSIFSWAQGWSEYSASIMLGDVLADAKLNGIELENAGVKYHSGRQGMGVLRLMVERGWLRESRILDGSIFRNCASVKEFRNSDPKIQFAKNNWHHIEEKNGVFQFKESVLVSSISDEE